MLYDTVQEYNDAIAETKAALKRVALVGEEHENNSGGSSRKMRDTSLKSLREHLSYLQKELKQLTGERGPITFAPGW